MILKRNSGNCTIQGYAICILNLNLKLTKVRKRKTGYYLYIDHHFKVFKNDKGYVKRVVNAIQLHLEIAVQVAQKIQKKFEQYIDKPAKQIGAIIRVCLMEDFGIE
jgi:uncharacterized C2H2 Zn-finger protein